jgi:hypothetical protein
MATAKAKVTALRVVRAYVHVPVVKDTVRPYRIWDSQNKKSVPHRCYGTERRALDSALLLVRWEKVSVTYEVFDIRTAKWIGTYVRRVDSIGFMGGEK